MKFLRFIELSAAKLTHPHGGPLETRAVLVRQCHGILFAQRHCGGDFGNRKPGLGIDRMFCSQQLRYRIGAEAFSNVQRSTAIRIQALIVLQPRRARAVVWTGPKRYGLASDDTAIG